MQRKPAVVININTSLQFYKEYTFLPVHEMNLLTLFGICGAAKHSPAKNNRKQAERIVYRKKHHEKLYITLSCLMNLQII